VLKDETIGHPDNGIGRKGIDEKGIQSAEMIGDEEKRRRG
jgi:hypothetical protein